jgi:hypothetical protein
MLFLESFPSLTNPLYILQIIFFVEDFGAVVLLLLNILTKNFPENLCFCAVANDGAKPNQLTACRYDKFVTRQKTWHDF